MKTISDYTNCCTPEQTKKALELGAPVEEYCGLFPTAFIDGIIYDIPTAEQMIGWLEEQEEIDEINVSKTWDENVYAWSFDFYDKNLNSIGCGGSYNSRKEATLAAIDAALEYLTNNKK